MYFVKYGDKYLHDPRVTECSLHDLKIDKEENSCGYCDFTIYPNHPMHNKLKERDTNNPVEVYDDDVLLFSGFIYELGEEFYLDGAVKCKGELDYLRDSVVRPYSTLFRGFGLRAPNTVDGYFEWLIEQHNSQVEVNKQFKMGINQGRSLVEDNYIFKENDKYPTTIDEISEKLLNKDVGGVGGYIRTRHENGVRYIDYISEWTDQNVQILDFGVNLTNYSKTDDSSSIATYVIPLGASMINTAYPYDAGYRETTDTAPVEGKIYYTLTENGYSQCSQEMTAFESGVTYYEYFEEYDESNQSLTLTGLEDGSYWDKDYVKKGDMIYCESAVEKYGMIGMKYENTEITTMEELEVYGIVALKEYISPKRTIEIKAVDMHLINPDIKPIQIGEYVRVRSKPHDLDSFFLCTSISLDLNNPENSVYTLGTTYDTLTGQQNKRINALNASVNKQIEKAQALTNEAKETAKLANATISKVSQTAQSANATAVEANTKADQAQASVTEMQNTVSQLIISTASVDDELVVMDQRISNNTSVANAAKADAALALEEIDELSSELETLSNTMTADYVRKTELTEVTAELESQINQNAGEISTLVTRTTTIDETASAAKTTADTAKTTADKAKTAADNAQDAADTAQRDVNELVVRVITAETAIEQNSEAIALRATKTEVTTSATNTLNSAKSYSDSQLDLRADSIETRVSTVEDDVENASGLIQNPSSLSWYTQQTTNIDNAAKTATSFMQYDSTNGLQVGNRQNGSWSGTRARMKNNAFEILDGSGNVLASYGASSIEFDNPVTFKADGITIDNTDALCALGQNNVLWSHATGYYMNASQTITLSANISRQLSGAVFAWVKYGTTSDWLYFFVPKSHVLNHGGASVRMSDPYLGVAKYLYVSNAKVTGVASNNQSGTMNGIAYNNSQYVLRYVIGV